MMKAFFVLIFLLCASFPAYGSLKCYKCESGKSLDDCKANKEEKTCDQPAGLARCGTISATINNPVGAVKHFVKNCYNEVLCKSVDKALKACKDAKDIGFDADCNISCCSDDLCNGAPTLVVSVIMMLACVFVAFIR